MKLLTENAEGFELVRPDGEVIAIPKRGLHREVQTHIRETLPKAEGYACGGEVKGYADGGAVPSIDVTAGVPQLASVSPEALDATAALLDPTQDTLPNAPFPTRDLNTKPVVMLPDAGPVGFKADGSPVAPVGAIDVNTGSPVGAPGPKQGLKAFDPNVPMPAFASAPPGAPGAGAYSAFGAMGMPPVAGLSNPYAKAQAYLDKEVIPGQVAAAKKLADAEAEQAKRQAELKGVEAGIRMEGAAAQQSYIDGRMKDYGALRDDLMNSRIDPHRLWDSRSTGQKASALIGIVLGGMGAGLTGGPNAALGVIDKMIDRDIEAQRQNLGKKMTFLEMHLKETGSMVQAMREVRIDQLSALQAQLEQAALEAASPKAQANAEATIAQINAQRVGLIEKSAEWQNQMAAAAAQRAWMTAQMQGSNGGGSQGVYVPGAVPPASPTGMTLKDVQDARDANAARRVEIAPGRFSLAMDAESAKKFREIYAAGVGARQTMAVLRDVVNKPGFGHGQERSATIHALAEDLARLQGQGGSAKAVEDWVGKIPGIFTPGTDAGLKALNDIIDFNINRMGAAYVGGPAYAHVGRPVSKERK